MDRQKGIGDFRAACPASQGFAVRAWLISDEDCRVVIQATLSDADDHVLASSFGEGPNIEIAQHRAILDAVSFYFGSDGVPYGE